MKHLSPSLPKDSGRAEPFSLTQELLTTIALDLVDADPANERVDVEEDLSDLINSLRSIGLQEPVHIYQLPTGRYLLASGHRRVAAARHLGWQTLRAVVGSPPHDVVQQTIRRLASNLCRKDIDPITLARSIQALLDQYSLTQQDIATWLGKSPATITHHLQLLQLPEPAQSWVQTGDLTVGHALQLLRIKEPELDWDGATCASATACQVSLGQAAVKERLSVRALEIRVRNWLDNQQAITRWQATRVDPPSSTLPSKPTTIPAAASDPDDLLFSVFLHSARDAARQQLTHATIREALAFDTGTGPTLDHLRLAALILADDTYFYHNAVVSDLPERAEMNRRIEKAVNAHEILNVIGQLAAAQVIADLSLDGLDLVGGRRTKWARGRFQLGDRVCTALQRAGLWDAVPTISEQVAG